MKVLWLNDSLVLRAENAKEKQALAVVYESLEPKEPADEPSKTRVGVETTDFSTA